MSIHAILHAMQNMATPLFIASMCGRPELVMALLDQGANPNITDEARTRHIPSIYVP